MAGRHDACGAVDVDALVVVTHQPGLAGVQAHAHAYLPALRPGLGVKTTLRLGARRHSFAGRGESDKEGVAFSHHLDPFVCRKRSAHHTAVAVEKLCPLSRRDLLHEAR